MQRETVQGGEKQREVQDDSVGCEQEVVVEWAEVEDKVINIIMINWLR